MPAWWFLVVTAPGPLGGGTHRREAGGRDAHHDGQLAGARDHALHDPDRLLVRHLGRLAQLAQHGHAVDARLEEEVRHAVDRGLVDPAVGMERRGRDDVHALRVDVGLHFFFVASYRALFSAFGG